MKYSMQASISTDVTSQSKYGLRLIVATALLTIFEPVLAPSNVSGAPLPQTEPTFITIKIPISNPADDAEEQLDGIVRLDSTDLELINDSDQFGRQVVGLRFQGLELPRYAKIVSAFLELTVDETDAEPTSVIIHGQAVGNAPTFTASNYNLSKRELTDANVAWGNIPPWRIKGQTARSPNLSNILQEIVIRSDWRAGNALAFLISGYGQRTAFAYDGSAADATRLRIKYSLPDGEEAVEADHAIQPSPAVAPRNIVLLIGDGMGPAQIAAAGIYQNGESGTLVFESAPHQAQMTTYAADTHITDSAASASAMATGHKTNKGVISVAAPGNGIERETVLEHFQKRCKSTGLVVTSIINHATPAAFAAHETSRANQAAVAQDYFSQTKPNLIFGGIGPGISFDQAANAGYKIVTSRATMQQFVGSAAATKTDHLLGLFSIGHMAFEWDYAYWRSFFYSFYPHLSEMTVAALDFLDDDPDGFFLMVEGSRIDHAGHQNDIGRTIYETIEFERAVLEVLAWAKKHPGTLIIVTSDHETGGLQIEANNGARRYPTVTWVGDAHTPIDVPVYAWGPNAEQVHGTIDNTDIYRILTAGSGIEQGWCVRQ